MILVNNCWFLIYYFYAVFLSPCSCWIVASTFTSVNDADRQNILNVHGPTSSIAAVSVSIIWIFFVYDAPYSQHFVSNIRVIRTFAEFAHCANADKPTGACPWADNFKCMLNVMTLEWCCLHLLKTCIVMHIFSHTTLCTGKKKLLEVSMQTAC